MKEWGICLADEECDREPRFTSDEIEASWSSCTTAETPRTLSGVGTTPSKQNILAAFLYNCEVCLTGNNCSYYFGLEKICFCWGRDVVWCDVMWCDVMWCDVMLNLNLNGVLHLCTFKTTNVWRMNNRNEFMFLYLPQNGFNNEVVSMMSWFQ